MNIFTYIFFLFLISKTRKVCCSILLKSYAAADPTVPTLSLSLYLAILAYQNPLNGKNIACLKKVIYFAFNKEETHFIFFCPHLLCSSFWQERKRLPRHR
jgi:hypothetical protein